LPVGWTPEKMRVLNSVIRNPVFPPPYRAAASIAQAA
jgi:hypothetical protein